MLNVDLALFTVIVGHATFCIVVVYNNAVARLRRTSAARSRRPRSDLGAGPWRAFRDVTFPQLRTALVAGALLAFALSFDEIIVTTFTAGSQETLPIWIFTNYSRPNQLPIVNVVGLSVIACRSSHRLRLCVAGRRARLSCSAGAPWTTTSPPAPPPADTRSGQPRPGS